MDTKISMEMARVLLTVVQRGSNGKCGGKLKASKCGRYEILQGEVGLMKEIHDTYPDGWARLPSPSPELGRRRRRSRLAAGAQKKGRQNGVS